MNKKLYPMYLKSLTAVFGMAVASTLIGCQTTNTQNQTTDTQTTETSQDAQTNNDSNYNDVKDYLQTQQEKDTGSASSLINFVNTVLGSLGMVLAPILSSNYVHGLGILLVVFALWIVVIRELRSGLKGMDSVG